MTPVGFEPSISAGERPQTYALDRVATGTGFIIIIIIIIIIMTMNSRCMRLWNIEHDKRDENMHITC